LWISRYWSFQKDRISDIRMIAELTVNVNDTGVIVVLVRLKLVGGQVQSRKQLHGQIDRNQQEAGFPCHGRNL